jgi:hypothetical protein
LWAWILTIPVTAALAFALMKISQWSDLTP